jgi:hypothetical protein
MYQRLRDLDPTIKPIVAFIFGFVASELLCCWLMAPVSRGVGFFIVALVSYPIIVNPRWSFFRWAIWSAILGLVSYIVTYFFIPYCLICRHFVINA